MSRRNIVLLTLFVCVMFALVYKNRNSQAPASGDQSQKGLGSQAKGIKKKHNRAYRSKDNPALRQTDLSPRKYSVIDIHEHAQSLGEAKRLLKAMDEFNEDPDVLVFILSTRAGGLGTYTNPY